MRGSFIIQSIIPIPFLTNSKNKFRKHIGPGVLQGLDNLVLLTIGGPIVYVSAYLINGRVISELRWNLG
jgi:hypothetical protein